MSKIVTLEQIKQEQQAQKRRDEAKKHLESIGQSIEKVDPKKANKSSDNTLELLLSEKRKNIVNLNNINTSTTSNKQSVPTTANNSNEKLQSGWQAVNDNKTGKTYYWNLATNETSWDKPVLDKLNDTSKQRELPPHWIEKIHEATFQTYWVHEKTGNKRWEMPSYDDDGGTATNKRTNLEMDNSSKKQQRIEPIGPSMKK
jgi:hypothetical protein